MAVIILGYSMGFALVFQVLGEIDRGHAPSTDFPLNGIAVS